MTEQYPQGLGPTVTQLSEYVESRLEKKRFSAVECTRWPTAAEATDLYRATVKQNPTTASVSDHFPGAYRVTPGDHTQSVVWLVSHLRGNYQMPPLVSHKVDEAGTQLLADWIDALPR